MLTVMCPPVCLSHQQNLCRLSFTLLNNPPSVSVSHPAAAALSFTSASDPRRAHPARDTVFSQCYREDGTTETSYFCSKHIFLIKNAMFPHTSKKKQKNVSTPRPVTCPSVICRSDHVSATVCHTEHRFLSLLYNLMIFSIILTPNLAKEIRQKNYPEYCASV